jgi:predicted DNA-binding transcriptional regulator YafY
MNVQKLKYFIHLIEKQRTGAPAEAAEKLGVSERTIYTYVNTLKFDLNAPIEFNKFRKSYQFHRPGKLIWQWVKFDE